MNLYDMFMRPLEKRVLQRLRKRLIPQAKGDVLEIGAGTGVNFAHYNHTACHSLTIVDKEISRFAEERANKNMTFVQADVMALPFADDTFDSVVETLMLCSVADVSVALAEIKRVLKPGGQLIHIDHALPETPGYRKLFRFLAPLWYGMTKSCRIDKEYEPLFKASGLNTVTDGRAGKSIFYWGVSIKPE